MVNICILGYLRSYFSQLLSTHCKTKLVKWRCLLESLLLSSDSRWGQEKDNKSFHRGFILWKNRFFKVIPAVVQHQSSRRFENMHKKYKKAHGKTWSHAHNSDHRLKCHEWVFASYKTLVWSKRGDQHLCYCLQYKLKIISANWRAILNQCLY